MKFRIHYRRTLVQHFQVLVEAPDRMTALIKFNHSQMSEEGDQLLGEPENVILTDRSIVSCDEEL